MSQEQANKKHIANLFRVRVRLVYLMFGILVAGVAWNVFVAELPFWVNAIIFVAGALGYLPITDWKTFRRRPADFLSKHKIGIIGIGFFAVGLAMQVLLGTIEAEPYHSIVAWAGVILLTIGVVLLFIVDLARAGERPEWLDTTLGRLAHKLVIGVCVLGVMLVLIDLFIYPVGILR